MLVGKGLRWALTEKFVAAISRPVAFSAAPTVVAMRVSNRETYAERFARMSVCRLSNAAVVLSSVNSIR